LSELIEKMKRKENDPETLDELDGPEPGQTLVITTLKDGSGDVFVVEDRAARDLVDSVMERLDKNDLGIIYKKMDTRVLGGRKGEVLVIIDLKELRSIKMATGSPSDT
jgi:hypothetical protein